MAVVTLDAMTAKAAERPTAPAATTRVILAMRRRLAARAAVVMTRVSPPHIGEA